jgi:hypothetical protein
MKGGGGGSGKGKGKPPTTVIRPPAYPGSAETSNPLKEKTIIAAKNMIPFFILSPSSKFVYVRIV